MGIYEDADEEHPVELDIEKEIEKDQEKNISPEKQPGDENYNNWFWIQKCF